MRARHFAQLVFLSAGGGASFPLIRISAPAVGPLPMACLRCALAGVVLAVLMRLTRQQWPARAHGRAIALLALLTVALPFVLFNGAGLVLPAGYSAVLNATAPLFGVLAGALFGEERLTGRKLAGCAVGLGGVALLVRLGPVAVEWPVVLGVLACVVASASYGFGASQEICPSTARISCVPSHASCTPELIESWVSSSFVWPFAITWNVGSTR